MCIRPPKTCSPHAKSEPKQEAKRSPPSTTALYLFKSNIDMGPYAWFILEEFLELLAQ